MGILPLRLPENHGPAQLNIQRGDRIEVAAAPESLRPRAQVPVTIVRADGSRTPFNATAAVETQFEVELLRDGGVIPHILTPLVQGEAA
jgi:aconitate hydratase